MRIVRQVLDAADFEHLVRGGTLQIDVRNLRAAAVELCLGLSEIQDIINAANDATVSRRGVVMLLE